MLYKKSQLTFKNEVFTEREAWIWLITHSKDSRLSCSIRSMATIWQWHRSKVARFLTKLQTEALIAKTVKFGKLHIIMNWNHNILASCSHTQHSKQNTSHEDNLPSTGKIIKSNRGS